MGREVYYCDSCGERILPKDLEKGRAVVAPKKKSCRKCTSGSVAKLKGLDPTSPRFHRPPPAS